MNTYKESFLMDGERDPLENFFATLQEARNGLLLLDYDGTLAPFRENRLEAYPAEGIGEALDKVLQLDNNQVVLVTGRPADEVLALLQPSNPICVWGCHGREYRDIRGEMSYYGVTEATTRALERGRERVCDLVDATRLDFKTGCLAIHWRGIASDEQIKIEEAARKAWEEFVRHDGLAIVNFDGGVELCVPGRSKGDAIEALLEDVDTEETAVAFLGDDLTDEDGFRALGKRGLSVLVRNEPRATAAQVRITMPDGVLEFFERWWNASQRREKIR